MSFIVSEGNATTDASLREYTSKRSQQSVPISTVAVAVVDGKYNAETDTWQDTGRTFYEVTVPGSRPSTSPAPLSRGSRLLIAGNVYVEEYRDNEGVQRGTASSR